MLAVGGSQTAVSVTFVAAAFGMTLFYAANYMLFAMNLTVLLVLAVQLGGGDAVSGGVQRLVATAIGAVIGILVFVIVRQWELWSNLGSAEPSASSLQ